VLVVGGVAEHGVADPLPDAAVLAGVVVVAAACLRF
jgi:multisubunit Na+/H+ antiporter MnhC subunit